MFEYLQPYIGKKKPPNRFWPVDPADVEDAERRLGVRFPGQLRTFYAEVGCGFLAQGKEDRRRGPSLVNGVLSPVEIASLLLDPSEPARPAEGFMPGVMPFFDVGEQTYLVMRPSSSQPDAVYWPDGKSKVSDELEAFFKDLYQRAGFYRGRP
jgi:hypothetical protein